MFVRNVFRRKWWLLGLIGILFILPLVLSPSYSRVLIEVLIFALLAASVNLPLGYGGVMVFCQALFFSIGAYAVVLLTVKAGFSLAVATISGPLLAMVAAIIIGYLCIRLGSMYFALITIGFGLLFYQLVLKWYSLTGGYQGITGIVRPDLISTTVGFYYFTLIVVLICFILIWILINSPFGKVIQGMRENKERLEFVGVDCKRIGIILLVIGAFFAAVAGVLRSYLSGGAFPTYAFWLLSIEPLLMSLIGGIGTFFGPPLGALVLVLGSTIAADYTKHWPAIVGIILITVVLAFRKGIVGTLQERFK